MPELPEVEAGRRLAERVAAGRTIRRVWCDEDPIVFDGVTPAHVRKALTGRRVHGVHRRGKHLWMTLDRAPHPLFHFGMTGAFRSPDTEPLVLASSGSRRDAGWPPRFAKIRLELDDGGELVMVNKRRLGRIRLRENPPAEPPISELGFDPIVDPPSPAEFARLLARRTGTLKGVLLDQGFAAGVGNWIADEVLYQAKLDPRRSVADLSAVEIRRLRTVLLRVVEKAVSVDADKKRFPRTWLFHSRWGREALARTAKGEDIEFLTIAGRTTAWVPSVQR
ncbi:MAG: DNA-formamidopyrimidine glycosylase family protein [bacterium]